MSAEILVWLGFASLIFFPLMVSMVDFVPGVLAERKRQFLAEDVDEPFEDFAVIVPIYGDTSYLKNLSYLARYGSRVVLTTTDKESETFNADLRQIAADYGFRIVWAPSPATGGGNARSTTGTIRDRIVREAVKTLSDKYVICLDADSEPSLPFDLLAGAMAENGFEVVSTVLYPTNTSKLLERLQVIEYQLSMRLRRIVPWLISGGCHAATTEAYSTVMDRHSLFFQGNDVEVGLLAEDLNYSIGHVEYAVGTEVPSQAKPWFRQRYAWSGGEWRLAIANIKFFPRHPWFFCYATLIMIGMFPLRWYAVITEPQVLPIVYLIYVVLISYLMRKNWSAVTLVYPFYAMFNSLFMIPLGGISYLKMSIKHHNWGQIERTSRHDRQQHN